MNQFFYVESWNKFVVNKHWFKYCSNWYEEVTSGACYNHNTITTWNSSVYKIKINYSNVFHSVNCTYDNCCCSKTSENTWIEIYINMIIMHTCPIKETGCYIKYQILYATQLLLLCNIAYIWITVSVWRIITKWWNNYMYALHRTEVSGWLLVCNDISINDIKNQ